MIRRPCFKADADFVATIAHYLPGQRTGFVFVPDVRHPEMIALQIPEALDIHRLAALL